MRRYQPIFGALCVLAALTAPPAAAQSRFGLRAGVNFAKLTGDDINGDAIERLTGFVGGGFLETPVSRDIVNLHLGLQYSQKGFETEALGSEASVKLDYLEVPALLAVIVPGSGTTDFRLYVGPTFSYRVKCSGTALGFSSNCDNDDSLKKFDLGGDAGAGLAFAIGSGTLLVDGFYNFGLTTIDNSSSSDDVRNEVFSVTAGIIFPARD